MPTNTPTDTPTDTPTNTPTNTPTDTPTAAPTRAAHGCASWCLYDTRPWGTKCGWNVCYHCTDCGAGAGACEQWCYNDARPWQTKCLYNKKCSECHSCQATGQSSNLVEVDHQVVRQAQHEVSERKQEVAPDLDSQCDGEGSNGKIIIDELFRLLDKKNDGHLDKDELLPVAKELGMYDGSPAQGSAFYAAWCDEHSIDPQKGTDQAQFERGILADETVPGVSKLSRAVFNILDTESDHYLTQDEFLYVARQLGIYTGSSADWPKFYEDHCAANNIPAKGISFQNFERVLCKHASVE